MKLKGCRARYNFETGAEPQCWRPLEVSAAIYPNDCQQQHKYQASFNATARLLLQFTIVMQFDLHQCRSHRRVPPEIKIVRRATTTKVQQQQPSGEDNSARALQVLYRRISLEILITWAFIQMLFAFEFAFPYLPVKCSKSWPAWQPTYHTHRPRVLIAAHNKMQTSQN